VSRMQPFVIIKNKTREPCNLILKRDAGLTKGRSAEEQARAVDDEDTSASLKAFHMLL